MSTVAARPSARRAWVWAGGLLVLSVVLNLARTTATMTLAAPSVGTVISWVADVLYAAALLLFAFGWQGEGSVVGRRVPGIIALIVLAAAPLLWLAPMLAYSPESSQAAVGAQYVAIAIWFVAAIIAAVATARAGVVPRPWHLAPTIALAVVAGLWVIIQLFYAALGLSAVGQVGVIMSLYEVAAILAPLALGILAIALGLQRPAPASVEVLSSREPS